MIKIDTQVELINYVAPLWSSDRIGFKYLGDNMYDARPELLGERGIVVKAELVQDDYKYALSGTTIYAWYDKDQLKVIHEPKYL